MKVLHVIPSLSVRTGGPPVAVVESALALRDIGVASTIVATDMAGSASAGNRGRIAPEGLPGGAAALDVRLFPARPPGRLAFSPALYTALRRSVREYDLVHVHSLFLFPQFAAYRAARAAGVPYIVSPRGALDPHLRRQRTFVKALATAAWQRRFIEQAALLHLTSDEEARQVDGLAPSVRRAIVPNGVRWNDYSRLPSPELFRRKHLQGGDAAVVLFLGRIAKKKGIDMLIRAFAIARPRLGDKTWLVIAGPDDERLTPSLRALAVREGVAQRTSFAGMLTGDAKLEALAAADVWALPSRGENFGNAVVEAMAASRAVVVSPEVNIAPEIAAAGAGIVSPRRVDALADQLEALLRDSARRAALGAKARAFSAQYDWGRVAPRLASMYEDASTLRRAA
jgi:glycosyltransferase involved in cell wall biosynthesis